MEGELTEKIVFISFRKGQKYATGSRSSKSDQRSNKQRRPLRRRCWINSRDLQFACACALKKDVFV